MCTRFKALWSFYSHSVYIWCMCKYWSTTRHIGCKTAPCYWTSESRKHKNKQLIKLIKSVWLRVGPHMKWFEINQPAAKLVWCRSKNKALVIPVLGPFCVFYHKRRQTRQIFHSPFEQRAANACRADSLCCVALWLFAVRLYSGWRISLQKKAWTASAIVNSLICGALIRLVQNNWCSIK